MSPKGSKIVVAGGMQSGHMMWLQVGCCPEQLVSAGVELSQSWDQLLKKAEEDRPGTLTHKISTSKISLVPG
ncbi:hypothetical protein ACFLXO_03030 [Chloroflexota bacterium]